MEGKRRNFTQPLLILAIALLSIFVGMKLAQFKISKNIQFAGFTNTSHQDKLSLVLSYIKSYYVDTVDLSKLEENIIPQLLKELDPHSVYISADKMQETSEPLTGNFDGIGVTFNLMNDTVVVINVIPKGPSESAGVLPGDRIVKVNDSIIAGVNTDQDQVMKMLRGKSGSKVTIGVKRNNEKNLINIPITRGKIPLKSVDVAYMITPTIGYIKISKFARSTYEEFKQAVDKLHEEGMKNIILDLRHNTGGFLDQAFEIANELLPKGKLVVYTEGRASKRKDYYSNGSGVCTNDSIVILIDEGSASASEILAGAIQDNDRGLIIGRRSFGKGLVQQPIYFSDGSGMRLTIARYYTPTGRSIQRAYSSDIEGYYSDIYSRIEHGEFLSADSIQKNDSLKYITHGGKVVYGGGGITPDIFVPIDTIGINSYSKALWDKNLIYKYALAFSDEHRKSLHEIDSVDKLNAFFQKKDLLSSFIVYASKNGVKPNIYEIKECSNIIEAQLKAFIARGTPLDDEGYYSEINRIQSIIEKSISELDKMQKPID